MADALHVLLAIPDTGEAAAVESVLRGRWPRLAVRIIGNAHDLHEAARNDRWDLLVVGANAPIMAVAAIREVGWNRLLIAISAAPETREAADLLRTGVRAVVPRDGIAAMVPIIAHEIGRRRAGSLRRQSDRLLARSEARYRHLFDASQDGILVIEAATGVVTEVNRALQIFLGYPACTLVGTLAGDDSRLAPLVGGRAGMAALATHGRLQRDGVAVRTAAGQTVWADVIGSSHAIDGERVFQFNIRDVTDRKRSEDGLERANRALRTLSRANESLVHANSEAQLVADACRILVKVGGFHRAWVAYGDAAAVNGLRMVGHHGPCAAVGQGDDPLMTVGRAPVERAMAGETQWLPLSGDDGCGAALVLPLGRPPAVLGVVTVAAVDAAAFDPRTRAVLEELADDLAYGIRAQRDRSLYVETEEALRSSEMRFRSMAESASDGLVVIDADGRVIFWNQAAEHIFGYAEDEVLGHELHALVAGPEDLAAYQHGMAAFIHTGGGPAIGRRMDLTARRKSGESFPIELTLSAARVGGGWQALGIVRDVSERKLMEERLHQADKMDALGNMAGGIAHDLKNMLFPVLSLIGLTIKELPADSRQRARLEKVLQAAERARTLVERIHAFSHRAPVCRSEVPAAQVVAEALGLVRPMLPATIRVVERWSFAPETHVCIDASQFDAIVMNFASNAADAMEGHPGTLTVAGGEVHMDSQTLVPVPGSYVWLSFTDTGIGIASEAQQKIFDPWFSTKGRGKGTGLGLAMVRKILAENGGAVMVASQPGQGSTFTIYLPRLAGDGGGAEEKETCPENGTDV